MSSGSTQPASSTPNTRWPALSGHVQDQWRRRRPDSVDIGPRVAWLDGSVRLAPPHGFDQGEGVEEVRYHPAAGMLLACDDGCLVTAVNVREATWDSKLAAVKAVGLANVPDCVVAELEGADGDG